MLFHVINYSSMGYFLIYHWHLLLYTEEMLHLNRNSLRYNTETNKLLLDTNISEIINNDNI